MNPRLGPPDADHLGWEMALPADPRLPNLIVIGDSTVMSRRPGEEGERDGWAGHLGVFFDQARVNVVDRALGGLSSRSYVSYGYWERALGIIKAGDFVLMQFGHNDSGPVNDDFRARGSLPGVGDESLEIENILRGGARETVRSYGWYLRLMASEARKLGASPLICSPVPRLAWDGQRIVRSPYVDWAMEAAALEEVPFVDLGAAVARRYEELGPETVKALFLEDGTHASSAGARLWARSVVETLAELEDPEASRLLSFRDGGAAAAGR
jgi:lysophospholipase L1-like esterase